MLKTQAIIDTISCRKSTRDYSGQPLTEDQLQKVREVLANLTPLFDDEPYHAEIVDASQVRCIQPWKTPHFLSVYAKDTPDSLMNVGYLFQQFDLQLQAMGIGVCWVGMGKPKGECAAAKEKGLVPVILLPFGHSDKPVHRENVEAFNRRTLAEIADKPDPRLEPARLAPSATNSQPWYFVHGEEGLHVYQVVQGPLKRMTLGKMNCVDMGIVLCHLAVTSSEDFALRKLENVPAVEGYTYIGTVPAF